MLDPIYIHPGLLTLSRSFLLRMFIPFDYKSKSSGSFPVANLKSLIAVPDV